jgi:lysophospholipase L1-like esterase
MTAAAPPLNEPPPRRSAALRPRRRWLFRLLALVLGLSPLLAFEGLCHLFDWGRPDLHDDPFVGFSAIHPLFVLSDDGTRYEIPKSRQRFFCAESFPAHKADGEFRIFCLGASTVQGRPFAIETSYTTWLEISLNAAQPEVHWDVVNCGGISYASYRLIPILKEVLAYHPDLIILDTGHNEFLEARSFASIKDRNSVVHAALAAASRLRSFTLLREGYLQLRGKSSAAAANDRPVLPDEVDALLDYQNGLAEYHRDPAWRAALIREFDVNLHTLVRIAHDAGVPLLLVNPCSNLRDFPPFKSEHRDGLTRSELEQWNSLCAQAGEHLGGTGDELRDAIACLEQACGIDPDYAETFYHLGHCYQAAHRLDDARRMFEQARDLDICPLRILQPMSDSLLSVAGETGAPLLDAQALFEGLSRDGIVGDQWLIDHVHPTIPGHQVLADALADKLVELHMLSPGADWAEHKAARYREHLDELPDLYFLKGMQRLENEQHWAHGRARRKRPASTQ